MKQKYMLRANSAPSMVAHGARMDINMLHSYQRALLNGNHRNLLNGFAVTHMPLGQPVNSSHLSVSALRRHYTRRRTLSNAFSITPEQKENIELRCCRINVLLVTMQICLGAMVTALAFYMQTLTSTLRIRECPYWAGIPLLFTGMVGVYFCATEFTTNSKQRKSLAIKYICFLLSTSCVFLCMVASVFPGFLGSKIAPLTNCHMTDTTCVCAESDDPEAKKYTYEDIDSCETLIASVKDYLILQCSLNCIASGVCFWFATLLWKSRYQDDRQPLIKIYACNGNVDLYSQNLATEATDNKRKAIFPPPSPLIGIHTSGKGIKQCADNNNAK